MTTVGLPDTSTYTALELVSCLVASSAHAPATPPTHAIEAAINDAIAHTPTPPALPATPLDRLGPAQP
jgi:hypothetical protein